MVIDFQHRSQRPNTPRYVKGLGSLMVNKFIPLSKYYIGQSYWCCISYSSTALTPPVFLNLKPLSLDWSRQAFMIFYCNFISNTELWQKPWEKTNRNVWKCFYFIRCKVPLPTDWATKQDFTFLNMFNCWQIWPNAVPDPEMKLRPEMISYWFNWRPP